MEINEKPADLSFEHLARLDDNFLFERVMMRSAKDAINLQRDKENLRALGVIIPD